MRKIKLCQEKKLNVTSNLFHDLLSTDTKTIIFFLITYTHIITMSHAKRLTDLLDNDVAQLKRINRQLNQVIDRLKQEHAIKNQLWKECSTKIKALWI